MTRAGHSRASELAPWVFLFALMAVALAIVLVTFALPNVPGVPYPLP